MFRLQATCLVLFISASAWATPSLPDSLSQQPQPPSQTLKTAAKADSTVHVGADSSSRTARHRPIHYRWLVDTSQTVCREPEETATDCWRRSPKWSVQDVGFPGARSRTLSLSTLEPTGIQPFYQPALAASPYGIGGALPFDRIEEGGGISEVWAPVLPLDTPITSLHWTRGALGLNQFTLNLRRMVGQSSYFGLQVQSDEADSGYYQYNFQVHQPYLSGFGIPALKRDSAQLVIQDTSLSIDAIEVRPRLGFWIDSQTVVETFLDWTENNSSMVNPTNPAANDSTQLLYPASFSATTFGLVTARTTEDYIARATLWHSDWDRELDPKDVSDNDTTSSFEEASSGSLNKLQTEWSPLNILGQPRAELTFENDEQENDYWLHGTSGPGPDGQAWGNQGNLEIDAWPALSALSLALNSNLEWRQRPDNVQEWLGGVGSQGELELPAYFKVTGSAGWAREGVSEDSLFRWQPALGLYPSPDLKPRTDLHLEAGSSWQNNWLGFGASWEEHQYGNAWESRVLPDPDICFTGGTLYRKESEPVCPVGGDVVPDSLALALVNYQEETRGLLHLSMLLRLGNWQLSLLNTYVLQNSIKDTARLAATQVNRQIPDQIFKGQLLWHRKLIGDRLGLQTQWDWEWTSARYVFASDLDGNSIPLKLDDYLDLDFTARMQIKTFMLYFRAMNLYHERYTTEAGVHPPGVNFRFGVDWHLFD